MQMPFQVRAQFLGLLLAAVVLSLASSLIAADLSRNFEGTERGAKGYEQADELATEEAVKELREGNSDVLFLYIGQVDETGHAFGFHPAVPEYVAAIERADGLVGRALMAMK